MKAQGGLFRLLVLLDLARQMKPRHGVKPGHGAAAGVQNKTLRTLFLDLKQAILGLVDKLA